MPSRTPHSMTAEVESLLGPAPASLAQPEVVVLRFRRHGIRLVPPLVVLVAIAAAAGYWVGALPAIWMNLLAGAGAILLGLGLGVVPVLGWLARRTTVTSRRVIVRRGLLARHRSELALSRVREVRSRRGLGQRMRGSGDIELLHGAESLRLEDVPGAERVGDALQELMERNYEHATRAQLQYGGAPGSQAPGQAGRPSAGDPGARFW
ncbi:PH domain-containing protein [Leucobacter allii]|uniref:PH domain-containing protein n=1 Tax=Leucobacter allii TaxID=2932247 RepID=UPI001FD3DAAC|nr:PH domain-containing protein [Leucobacter allii]UOR00984.1 PH domain-containing protein [Leucobacter allii]